MFDLTNCHFAFLDLETTGLSPWFGDRICEVWIVLSEGKRIRTTYQTLVNPGRPLSPAAASTNGLRDAELVTAPPFAEVAEEVAAHLCDKIVVCHNAQFDKMMEALKPPGGKLDKYIGIYNSPAWPNDGIRLPTELVEAIQSGKRLRLVYVDGKGQQWE